MTLHQVSGEFGGTVHCAFPAVAPVFAHFNADACAVAHAIDVSMLSLLIGYYAILEDSLRSSCATGHRSLHLAKQEV